MANSERRPQQQVWSRRSPLGEVNCCGHGGNVSWMRSPSSCDAFGLSASFRCRRLGYNRYIRIHLFQTEFPNDVASHFLSEQRRRVHRRQMKTYRVGISQSVCKDYFLYLKIKKTSRPRKPHSVRNSRPISFNEKFKRARNNLRVVCARINPEKHIIMFDPNFSC